MKLLLMASGILITVLVSCNNNDNKSSREKSDVATLVEDSASSTLEDLSDVTDIRKLLCQDWENKEDAEDAAASGGGGSLEMAYRGLSFFEDGSVTENPRGQIHFGKWKLDDATKVIDVDLGNGQKVKYKIGGIGARQMLLMNMSDKKKTAFMADAKAQLVATDDPFYPSNNKWRIKPAKAETDSAIKLRTQQCILFYAKFLNDNAQRGGNTISFVGLPACFKWYRGGVSLVGKDRLEEQWINCFYNKAQALQAHTMLENIISKKYEWNKAETNWVKQSADVVMQMYDKFKSTSISR